MGKSCYLRLTAQSFFLAYGGWSPMSLWATEQQTCFLELFGKLLQQKKGLTEFKFSKLSKILTWWKSNNHVTNSIKRTASWSLKSIGILPVLNVKRSKREKKIYDCSTNKRCSNAISKAPHPIFSFVNITNTVVDISTPMLLVQLKKNPLVATSSNWCATKGQIHGLDHRTTLQMILAAIQCTSSSNYNQIIFKKDLLKDMLNIELTQSCHWNESWQMNPYETTEWNSGTQSSSRDWNMFG